MGHDNHPVGEVSLGSTSSQKARSMRTLTNTKLY